MSATQNLSQAKLRDAAILASKFFQELATLFEEKGGAPAPTPAKKQKTTEGAVAKNGSVKKEVVKETAKKEAKKEKK